MGFEPTNLRICSPSHWTTLVLQDSTHKGTWTPNLECIRFLLWPIELCEYIGVLDGIWTHAIRSHNPLLYLTELLTQCWWKDLNFQLLPYESSLLPLKYISYYSSWPMLGWWELNSPVTNYSFNCLTDRGDTSQCAEKVGIEPTTTGFGDQCSTNWATSQLLSCR